MSVSPFKPARPAASNGFGRSCRLLTPAGYADTFAARRTLRSGLFVLHYRLVNNDPANNDPANVPDGAGAANNVCGRPSCEGYATARLGLVISKKNARAAVVRNAIKRQIREAFRLRHLQQLVIVVRLALPLPRQPTFRILTAKAAWRADIESLFDRLAAKTATGTQR